MTNDFSDTQAKREQIFEDLKNTMNKEFAVMVSEVETNKKEMRIKIDEIKSEKKQYQLSNELLDLTNDIVSPRIVSREGLVGWSRPEIKDGHQIDVLL